MTTFRSEEGLVGLLLLGVVPWIAWVVRRGLHEDRLPLGRSYVVREDRPGAFLMVLAFYLVSAVVLAFICLDLLFNIDVRFWS